MKPAPSEVLDFMAREEPLSRTLQRFPELTREDLERLLAATAEAARTTEARLPRKARAVPAGPTLAAPGGSMRHLRVYSDGAARGNPGPAGAGAVLLDASGQLVEELGRFLGRNTNNYAEYMGVILGLERALELGAREVDVFADSQLMIRQLSGHYQVKAHNLRPLWERARELLSGFERVKLTHVPREQNQLADAMSNRAIDERM